MSCCDVLAADQRLAGLAMGLEAVDQLGPQDVDLAVEQSAPVGDLALLVGQLVDQLLELLVAHRADVRKGVLHLVLPLALGPAGRL